MCQRKFHPIKSIRAIIVTQTSGRLFWATRYIYIYQQYIQFTRDKNEQSTKVTELYKTSLNIRP